MTTYKEIQDHVKREHGFTVKTCWIAHIKELHGIKMQKAPNRVSDTSRKYPCPESKRKKIESVMEKLGVI